VGWWTWYRKNVTYGDIDDAATPRRERERGRKGVGGWIGDDDEVAEKGGFIEPPPPSSRELNGGGKIRVDE
jgi:hypothetical protein